MNTSRKLLLVGLALIVGCSSVSFPSGSYSNSSSVEVVSTGAMAVDVQSRNGSVVVQTDETATVATVEFDINTSGDTDAHAKARYEDVVVSAKEVDGVLQVRVVFPEPVLGNDGASVIVTLPELTDVGVRTSNGDVEVIGVNGNISLTTSNGAVALLESEGSAVIASSNGEVTARDFAGALEVVTSNAEIVVTLSPVSAEAIFLQTSNSDIQLTVGESFIGEIMGSTSNGRVEVSDSTSRASQIVSGSSRGSVSLGEGKTSRLATSNGSIAIIVQ